MINIPLLWQTIKSNAKFFILFTIVLCVFLVVMSYVFTPDTVAGLEVMSEGSALGHIFGSNGTLMSFMANSFYALMAIVFPMVYSIMVGNRLIAEKVDRGTMACLLSTPISRMEILITSASYFIGSLISMWGIVTVVGYVAIQFFQPGALDVSVFIQMNIGCFLYHFVISAICFSSSCIFQLSRHSLMLGAGIPLTFLLSVYSSSFQIIWIF